MDISILITKSLGVYLIASGIFLLFRGKFFAHVLRDLFDHPALMWLAGLVLIVLGGMIVFYDSEMMIVTVFGWLTLAKGFIYIIYPQLFSQLATKPFRSFTGIWGILCIALGIWLAAL